MTNSEASTILGKMNDFDFEGFDELETKEDEIMFELDEEEELIQDYADIQTLISFRKGL
jgi:hypothetical protein